MTRNTLIALMCLMIPGFAVAQGVFIYPAQGQSEEQMAQDKAECAEWAKSQTGYDPANPPKPEPVAVEDKPAGGKVAGGAARGALAGNLLANAVGGNRTGGGAAGALVGGAKAAKQAEAQKANQQAQAEQQAQAKVAERKAEFDRANQACLEGRGYTTK